MIQVPQFGQPRPSRIHRDRPAAFGLALCDGLLALVRVTYPEAPAYFDLPGGAIDEGESAPQALIREFGEETGLRVAVGGEITRADQYFVTKGDDPVNNRCVFFEAALVGVDASLKVEQDHELVWQTPDAALRALRHDAHAWALAAWLRKQAN